MSDSELTPGITKVNIEDMFPKTERTMISNLIIPSRIHTYSLCVEFMKSWFLSTMPEGFFNPNSIYIDGKHIYDDFRRFSRTDFLKRQKPLLAIIPQLEFNFNRDFIDMNISGINSFVRRSRAQAPFFEDYDNNLKLLPTMDMLKMQVNFRVKVATRSQQVDLYEYMKLAFRVGCTWGINADMDIHIPYYLIMQIAQQAGFDVDVENRKIHNITGVLSYLNGHSKIPFMYKFRNVNGKDEFFLRMKNLYCHIRALDLSTDDGSRDGQVMTDFALDFTTEVRFPAMQSYLYYSETKQNIVDTSSKIDNLEDSSMIIHTIKILNIPDTDENGWNKLITTEVAEDSIDSDIELDFNELFEGSDILKVINYTKNIMLSPSTFVDIKMYNSAICIPYEIDWDTLQVKIDKKYLKEKISDVAIYVDTDYMNNAILHMDDEKDSRIN